MDKVIVYSKSYALLHLAIRHAPHDCVKCKVFIPHSYDYLCDQCVRHMYNYTTTRNFILMERIRLHYGFDWLNIRNSVWWFILIRVWMNEGSK